jgi:hypothetical protein
MHGPHTSSMHTHAFEMHAAVCMPDFEKQCVMSVPDKMSATYLHQQEGPCKALPLDL